MAEYNGVLYLGRKDGTIQVTDQRAPNIPSRSFVPHNGKDVLVLNTSNGFLVTLGVNK